MVSRSDAPGSIIGLEQKRPYPSQCPTSCCHRLKIWMHHLFHFADSCICHQPRRACPRASQIFSGRFKGHIKSHSFLPSETVNHCFWGVINPDILVHDAMHFRSLAEQISAKEENPDSAVFGRYPILKPNSACLVSPPCNEQHHPPTSPSIALLILLRLISGPNTVVDITNGRSGITLQIFDDESLQSVGLNPAKGCCPGKIHMSQQGRVNEVAGCPCPPTMSNQAPFWGSFNMILID